MLYVKVLTLGCKLNQAESEAIVFSFMSAGFKTYAPGKNNEGPSLIIVNTCTVTSKADQKTRREIRKALRENPGACVIATGCYAQIDLGEKLKIGRAHV